MSQVKGGMGAPGKGAGIWPEGTKPVGQPKRCYGLQGEWQRG